MGKPAETARPCLPSLSHSFTLDFVVLCNGTKAEARAMKQELGELLRTMGLTLSEEKTKVTHITEGFKFLGYWIIRAIGGKGKMVPKVLVPDSAITRYLHKMRRILSPRTISEATVAKIHAINRLTRGWCQYYQITGNPSMAFSKATHELLTEMKRWLGRKYELSGQAIWKRYGKKVENAKTFGTSTVRLILPNEFKTRKTLVRTWHNPYTEKEAIIREKLLQYDSLWTGNQDRLGWSDIREEVILQKETTCYVCGTELHPYEVEIGECSQIER